MANNKLSLKEESIEDLFTGGVKKTYEIPIYQRNYAWGKDEISALVQDIHDAYVKEKQNKTKRPYYIGTLVSYDKGDNVFEIIDGQQRLTTLKLLCTALGITPKHQLTYRARKKSDYTLNNISNLSDDAETDNDIVNGFKFIQAALVIVSDEEKEDFISFFKTNVHIIHYHVPKDIDLNHYFEIMNSRGEQLEKHEIVKASLMEKLHNDAERQAFNRIWESCSELSVYLQQNFEENKRTLIFGNNLNDFRPADFNDFQDKYCNEESQENQNQKTVTIEDIIRLNTNGKWMTPNKEEIKKDSFLPIIDFPNFLLIVLKITRMSEADFSPLSFKLDDKELLTEFDEAKMDAEKVKRFAFNLVKARFFLDNYVVHHSNEEDTIDSNPWKLQVWHKDEDTKRGGRLKNLSEGSQQDQLVQLLSMFEVSFTARQRKNYLFYCLFYLLENGQNDLNDYLGFVKELADRYFHMVYLDHDKLNEKNTPNPGSFDEVMLNDKKLNRSYISKKDGSIFNNIYGDGTYISAGVPLYVFNYLDYRLWTLYNSILRGEKFKANDHERREFFEKLGCNDFGQDVFAQFYFSRTRRSLEHYFPQADADGKDGRPDQNQINCFGNFAMIGSDANSSGSNWSPETKISHYLDSSKKISPVSAASLKFRIMMQICKDNQQNGMDEPWSFRDIREHQERMINVCLNENESDRAVQDQVTQHG